MARAAKLRASRKVKKPASKPARRQLRRKGGKKKAATVKKLGKQVAKLSQAATMTGKLWPAWCKHLLHTTTSWLYVLSLISHMLCLRVSEALALKAGDFSWRARRVRVRPLKWP